MITYSEKLLESNLKKEGKTITNFSIAVFILRYHFGNFGQKFCAENILGKCAENALKHPITILLVKVYYP